MYYLKLKYLIGFCIVLLLCPAISFSQKNTDTIKVGKRNFVPKSKFVHNIFNDAVHSVSRNPNDTINAVQILLTESENSFQQYEGKIIRHIILQRFGFERTFTDTTKRIRYFGTKVLNVLHTDTREWVVRNYLFIKEKVPLVPYKIADNERYLRTLNFMQDARIIVVPIEGNEDSVDLKVVTKDLFSISGVLDISDLKSFKIRAEENNFLGLAQKVQTTIVYNTERSPNWGYEFLYRQNNISGSFIDGTIAYSVVNSGRSVGNEEEKSFYFRLERPMISPYSQMAGGLELSFNQAQNVYHKTDSLFYRYRYNLADAWLGYNLGINNIREDANYKAPRNRTFVSLRYLHLDFEDKPTQVGEAFDPVYNSKQVLLGQISFFKQDFFKLNYIYGFGTTEDVPQGYNISLTGGWHRQLDRDRAYIGLQADQTTIIRKGSFINAGFRIGGFLNGRQWEDAMFLARINYFSPLFPLGKNLLREYIKCSYTQINHRVTNELIRINNSFGIYQFNTDSLNGAKRFSLNSETVLFTQFKVFGFRFAPYIYGECSMLTPENKKVSKSDLYTGVGGGFRTRNENLIFGTIELRCIYFPRSSYGVESFKVEVSSDLRFRYSSNFVKQPDIIQLNRED